MKIEHNICIDLTYALSLIAERETYPVKMADRGLEINEQIQDWLQYVDDNISDLLKSDIDLLFKDSFVNHIILLFLVFEHDAKTFDELLKGVNKMSVETYLNHIFNCYLEIEDKDEQNEKGIRKILSDDEQQLEVKALLQFTKYPQLTLNRINQTITIFYNEFIKPFEQQIENGLKEIISRDEKLLKDNKEEFFQIVTGNHYLFDQTKITNKLLVYTTYFYFFGHYTYFRINDDNQPVMIYNPRYHNAYTDEEIKRRTIELFKTLSDEKRIDILRLLSKREWYSKELANHFGLSTATMSYHMNKLSDLGLVSMKTGELNRLYYYLNVKKAKELFNNIIKDTFGSI